MDKCKICHTEEGTMMACVCHSVVYCSKKCQRDDWKDHKHHCTVFRVGQVGDKGRGMFATRNIAPASVILTESPVLSADTKRTTDDKILHDFLQLSEETQNDVLKLHDAESDAPPNLLSKLLRIMNYNSVRTNNLEKQTEVQTLYLKNSFFNHSCNPNCCWVPDDKSDMLTVRSLVPIRKGQELTINYFFCLHDERGELCLLRNERRQKIRRLFHFDCLCQVCSEDEDDGLRQEYQDIDKGLKGGFTDLESTMQVLELAEMKLELGRKINNQVLFRDLMDCLIPIKCLMDHGYQKFGLRYQELMVEFKKILPCYNNDFVSKMRNELKLY